MVGITQSINNNFEELSIELTNKCGLNCIYCSSSASIKKDEFINLDRIKKIISEVKRDYKVTTISLSGGETFLYPNFVELFQFLKENDFEIKIYTSGIIEDSNGNLKELSTKILRNLYISKKNPEIILNIQGHNEQLIEKVNGIPNSFELIEKTIENILSTKLYLGAHIVPFKYNYQFLNEIVDFYRKKQFNGINFLRFVPQGRGGDDGFYNSPSEFKDITKSICQILKKYDEEKEIFNIRVGHPINFLFLIGENKLYDKEDYHYCRGGNDAPLILMNGNVVMCPAWKDLEQFYAGNIYKQNFKEIWNSNNFRTFRSFINEEYININQPCRICKHLHICRGKCVAQRLLAQKDKLNDYTLEELILYSPDPQCFIRELERD